MLVMTGNDGATYKLFYVELRFGYIHSGTKQ